MTRCSGISDSVAPSVTPGCSAGVALSMLNGPPKLSSAPTTTSGMIGLLVLAIALAKSRDEGYIEAGDALSSQTAIDAPDRQDVRS